MIQFLIVTMHLDLIKLIWILKIVLIFPFITIKFVRESIQMFKIMIYLSIYYHQWSILNGTIKIIKKEI